MADNDHYLVIGAGPCGLAMARALKEKGIPYEHVEATDDIGGNWNHGVYDSIFTDASKQVMAFSEYGMPKHYPDFLSKQHMLEYLRDYSRYYDLENSIQFQTKVTWIEREGDRWKVTLNAAEERLYHGIVICNGHHWDMRHPELDGHFSGEYIHSKQYKSPLQLKGKRILVIGAGNSAADVACEAARVGASSTMSIRNSPWIFPKSFAGIPLGDIKLRKAPNFLNPIMIKLLIRFTFGRHEYYGLETPNHGYFDKHPTVSEELPYYLKHGRIKLRMGVKEASGSIVIFEDGVQDDFDLIVACTGFHLSFPFLPDHLNRVEGQNLRCVGYSCYPDQKGLYFIGWPQVRGGIGSLASAFSKVLTDLIKIEEKFNIPAGKVLEACGDKISQTNLYSSKEVFQWVKRRPYKKLEKAATSLMNKGMRPKENVSDPEYHRI